MQVEHRFVHRSVSWKDDSASITWIKITGWFKKKKILMK